MWTVTVEGPAGVALYHYDTEAEATEVAVSWFDSMDTAEARETIVGVARSAVA